MKHPSHQPPSHPPPSRELLSAYFDGEVSAAERAEVERLLAEDEDAAAWLEELSDLRMQLQTLPVRRLENDFSEQVLRQAERAVLLGKVDTPAATPAERNGHVGKNIRAEQNGHARHTVSPAMPRGDFAGITFDTAPRAARSMSRSAQAPTWLAAAASLLLCAGLFFAAGQREQSVAARSDRERGLVATRQSKTAEALRLAETRTSAELPRAAGKTANDQAVDDNRSAATGLGKYGRMDEALGASGGGSGGGSVEGLEQLPANGPQPLFGALSPQAASDKHVKAEEKDGAETSLAAGGHVLVVCDVAEPPAEAFGRFENWLRSHRLAKYALEADEPAASSGNANKGKTPAAALQEGKGQPVADSAATRLYYVNVPQGELAQTLRNVAQVANGEMSVSSLGVPAAQSAKAAKDTVGYMAGLYTAGNGVKRALSEKAWAMPPQERAEGGKGSAKALPAEQGQVRAAKHDRRGGPGMPPTVVPVEGEAKAAREHREIEAAERSLAAPPASSHVSVILVLRAAPPPLPSSPPNEENAAKRVSK